MGMTPSLSQKATARVSASGTDEPSTSRADGTVVEMRKTNVTIIASPKTLKKYVLEYEGGKIPSIVIKK